MTAPGGETPVVILGAGGTGLYMAETVELTAGYRFVGFLDHAKSPADCCGYKVLGGLTSWRDVPEDHQFLSSLYGAKRMAEFQSLVNSLGIPETRWATVIDPRAAVSRHTTIGPGSFVGVGCVVEPAARLGRGCALLGSVYVAHHTTLGDFACCANSASLAGGVEIGDAAYIGSNSSVREFIRIGSRAIVGMGSVVIRDVPPGEVVAGNPAQPTPKPRP